MHHHHTFIQLRRVKTSISKHQSTAHTVSPNISLRGVDVVKIHRAGVHKAPADYQSFSS